jgi:hypothetical protein
LDVEGMSDCVWTRPVDGSMTDRALVERHQGRRYWREEEEGKSTLVLPSRPAKAAFTDGCIPSAPYVLDVEGMSDCVWTRPVDGSMTDRALVSKAKGDGTGEKKKKASPLWFSPLDQQKQPLLMVVANRTTRQCHCREVKVVSSNMSDQAESCRRLTNPGRRILSATLAVRASPSAGRHHLDSS